MVIEDSPSDLEFLRRAVEDVELPIQLLHCGSGSEAIEALRTTEPADLPELVLLDLDLPGCSGQEVLRQIRDEPTLESLPVVILTSSTLSTDRDNCRRLGANGYLVKPDRYDQLVTLVASLPRFLPKH